MACYLRDQLHQKTRAHQFDQLIASDNPDLSGGIKFVKSQRHEVYLEAHALKKYLRKLFNNMGWPAVDEGYYKSLRNGAGYIRRPCNNRQSPFRRPVHESCRPDHRRGRRHRPGDLCAVDPKGDATGTG
ncbi:Monooxygenase flavin-binding protein [Pseudomonas syringae pv. tagetis]|nr:Monooxygenase flavin-binding protein [Pseudomonas syringae pv. tagetis]